MPAATLTPTSFARVRFYYDPGHVDSIPAPCPRLLLEDDRDARDLASLRPCILRAMSVALGFSLAEAEASFDAMTWEPQCRTSCGRVDANAVSADGSFEVISSLYWPHHPVRIVAAVDVHAPDGSLIMACDFVTPDCMG